MRKFWRQTVRRAAQGECVQSMDCAIHVVKCTLWYMYFTATKESPQDMATQQK